MPAISDLKVYDSSGAEPQRPFKETEIITVVLEGNPGMGATFRIHGLMDEFKVMTETSVNGVYEGNYTVKSNDDTIGITITGNLIETGGGDAAVPLTKNFAEIVLDTRTPGISNAFFVAKDKQGDVYETLVPYAIQPEEPYYPYGAALSKPLNRFDKIEVTMFGEENATAYFSITNVASNIPMEETSQPGLYKGEYVIQAGDNSETSQVICFLVDAAEHINNKICLGSFTVDTTMANIISYGHNLTGEKPVVTGESIEVFIQGEPGLKAYFNFIMDFENHPGDYITAGQNYINMYENENPGFYIGRYTAIEGDLVHNGRIKLHLEDKAGNVTDILLPIWLNISTIRPTIASFVVQTFSEGSTFVYPLPSGNVEVNSPLNVNKLIVAIAEGAPGQQVDFSIETLVSAQGLGMVQYDEGLYLGSYIVQEGDNALESKVLCKFTDEAGNKSVLEAKKKITIDTTIPVVNEVILKDVPNKPKLKKIEIDVTF